MKEKISLNILKRPDPYDPEEAVVWRGHPFRWAVALLTPVRWRYILALVLTLAGAVFSLFPSIATGRIVDDVLIAGNVENFYIYALMLGGIPIIRSVIRYIYRILYEDASQYGMIRLRDALYKRLQQLNPSYYHEVSTGALMARLTGDLGMLRFFWSWVGWSTVEQVILFIIGAIYLMTISWQLTLACLIVTPGIAITAYTFSRKIGPVWSKVRVQLEKLTAVVQENIAANRIVRAFVRQDYEIERFEKENSAYRKEQFKTADIGSLYIPIMNAFATCLSIPMLLIGGLLVMNGKMSLGDLVIYSGLLFVLERPMFTVGFQINDLQRVSTSANKLLETLTAKPEVEDPSLVSNFAERKKDPEAYIKHHYEREIAARERYHWKANTKTARRTIDDIVQERAKERVYSKAELRGDIVFDHVDFSYERWHKPHQWVLNDLSFSIPAGSRVGFIGPTGSGKTTVTRLISRLYDPNHGRILIDGKDLREYDLRELRRQIAVVTQEVFLFSDTIDGNIAFSQPDLAPEKVVKSAKLACADEFIRNTSEGYDTIVGERGVGLSGGQKQRISLARAIAADASILILDDTTSAVDLETDRQIRHNLREMEHPYREIPQTTIIIAQRIASIRDCDMIFVLDEGFLVESGTHEELVNYGGIYRTIYEMQLGQSRLVAKQMQEAQETDKEA